MAFKTLITWIVFVFLATAFLAVGAPLDSNMTFNKVSPSAASTLPYNEGSSGVKTSDKSFTDSLACFFSLGLDREACEHTKKVRRSEGIHRRMIPGGLFPSEHQNHTNGTNSTYPTNSTIPKPMATLSPKPVDQPVVSQKYGLGTWLLCILSLGHDCKDQSI